MIEELDDDGYVIKLDWITKHIEGQIDFDNKLLKINVDLILVQVFLHEYAHYKYPAIKSEKVIDEKALKILRRMTKKQIKILAYKIRLYADLKGGE